jgi:transposase
MAPSNRNQPKNAKSSTSTYTIMDFMRQFPDDAACLEYLWRRHYATTADGEHAQCPKCEEVRKFHRVASRPSYSCDVCGWHIHPTANTIMHKSSTSLQLWFHAIFLMAQTRCGISAKQLERELGVTYKTAWRMFTLIRNELMVDDKDPLSGAVEMDETYVGGKPRQSDRAKWETMPSSTARRQAAQAWSNDRKTTVFGMVKRGGDVVPYVVPKKPQAAIMAHIENRVQRSETIVYTDDARIYDRLPVHGWEHRSVNHSARIYVDGLTHTNTIEGFWSLVKLGILGTHRHVSAKWLQGYLNEYAWRYNRRHSDTPMFTDLLDQIQAVL